MQRRTTLVAAIVGVPVVLGFLSPALERWGSKFDDAFITYRYAKNLALGHGITWNPGMAPTEGYTNFLLVIFLAPFIRIGTDPLLVTRIASYASALAMAAIIYAVGRRKHNCSRATAVLISSLVLLDQQTQLIALLGLETVIYALFLLAAFHVACEFIVSRRTRTAIMLSVVVVCAMLLRPEAVLLYPVVVIAYLRGYMTGGFSRLVPLIAGVFVASILGLAYLAWKHSYFGVILPNPYFIKVDGNSFFSQYGAHSVVSFLKRYFLLLSVFGGALYVCVVRWGSYREEHRAPVVLGAGLLLLYSLFFVRVDTLMDLHGRFMYPLLPVLIYASLPLLCWALKHFEEWAEGSKALMALGTVCFVVAFGNPSIGETFGAAKRTLSGTHSNVEMSLMHREYLVAQSLSQYPDIQNVRIAFGDSGVIPYYTGAIWLDVVGLNDHVIARTRNWLEGVDYFFDFESDLIIHPGLMDFSWLPCGHGPLGDYRSWANDPRWDAYVYTGTCKTGEFYDLQFLVRKCSKHYKSLVSFLEEKVVDGRYEPFPYTLGTYTPPDKVEPTWVIQSLSKADIKGVE